MDVQNQNVIEVTEFNQKRAKWFLIRQLKRPCSSIRDQLLRLTFALPSGNIINVDGLNPERSNGQNNLHWLIIHCVKYRAQRLFKRLPVEWTR